MNKIAELIRMRRSVRTYDGRALDESIKEQLLSFANAIQNPFNIPVKFKFLDAKKDGLTCPVVSGTELYVGGKIENVPNASAAFGYSFEEFVLYAQSLGLGTVWLGGTMNRSAFEQAMDLGENEMMPCATPIGYSAKKMSIRETMMRKAIKADERLPFEELFFDGSFDNPLTKEKAGKFAELLEMVRLAPSAVNKQPWRVVVADDTAHFYLKRSKGFSHEGKLDMQMIDMGIALCHFALTAKENGLSICKRIQSLGSDRIDGLLKAFEKFSAVYDKVLGNPYYHKGSSPHLIYNQNNLSIIKINTAWLDTNSENTRNLRCGTEYLLDLLEENQAFLNQGVNIAVGHHPLDELASEEKHRILTLFQRYNIGLYFCGHVHRPSIVYFKENDVLQFACTGGFANGYSEGGYVSGICDTDNNLYRAEFYNWNEGSWSIESKLNGTDERGVFYFNTNRFKHNSNIVAVDFKLYDKHISRLKLVESIGDEKFDTLIYPYGELDPANIDWRVHERNISSFSETIKYMIENNQQVHSRGEDMKLQIKDFAELTGVSVRTLHYYDEIGLLKPSFVDEQNGYRFYDENSLERMQEILFYRELDFPLKSIAEILASPNYDKQKALAEQKRLLTLKKDRLERLIAALEQAEKGEITMSAFDNSEYETARQQYEDEAKQRWGATDAYKESQAKTVGYSKDKWNEVLDGMNGVFAEFAECKNCDDSADSDTVQNLVKKLQNYITANFYHCTDDILAGLGQMYICDERFKNNIDSHGEGTAEFVSEAIKIYCMK